MQKKKKIIKIFPVDPLICSLASMRPVNALRSRVASHDRCRFLQPERMKKNPYSVAWFVTEYGFYLLGKVTENGLNRGSTLVCTCVSTCRLQEIRSGGKEFWFIFILNYSKRFRFIRVACIHSPRGRCPLQPPPGSARPWTPRNRARFLIRFAVCIPYRHHLSQLDDLGLLKYRQHRTSGCHSCAFHRHRCRACRRRIPRRRMQIVALYQ